MPFSPNGILTLLRAQFRALRIVIHIVSGLLLALAVSLDRGNRLSPERITHWWNRVLLTILNIRCVQRGQSAGGARLTVANHVSWLDIPVIAASEATRFVSKSEVQHWPVAGWLADAAGTFYIGRGKGRARPLLDKLTPHLAQGGSVVIFPEGTTTDGSQVLDFHARLFGAAIEASCPVQPIALRYSRAHTGENIAPFIGDDDLVSHIWRLLKEPQLIAEISYCAPVRADERDALANAARVAICAELHGENTLEVSPELELEGVAA